MEQAVKQAKIIFLIRSAVVIIAVIVAFIFMYNQRTTSELPLGEYISDSDDILYSSSFSLKPDNRFQLITSLLSSTIYTGTYSIKNNQLIFSITDNEKFMLFDIKDEQLIVKNVNADHEAESMGLSSVSHIQEGTVFKLSIED